MKNKSKIELFSLLQALILIVVQAKKMDKDGFVRPVTIEDIDEFPGWFGVKVMEGRKCKKKLDCGLNCLLDFFMFLWLCRMFASLQHLAEPHLYNTISP